MGNRGFTLIEVIITIAIIAVLASAVLPLSQLSSKRGKEMELRQSLRLVRTAIDDYKRAWDEGKIKRNVGESGYPPDLKTLEDGVPDAQNPQAGNKIRFLRRVPRDPMNPDKDIPGYESWGLRSYRSDPDDPQEGDDVFDVYSKSDETAIDRTPYKTW